MPDSSNNETIRFLYTFEFPDSTEKEFEVKLNAKTLELATKKDLPKPAWTKLKYKQCEQCPLGDEHEYCPVAVNLSALVESFKDSVSYESTNVRVQTNERIYEKATTLQKGLSSIIGMYMVTEDANMNAVVILSAYAEMVPFSIEHRLAELEYIFSEYTKFE